MQYDQNKAMEWLQTIKKHTWEDAFKQFPPNTLRHAEDWLHIRELAKKGLIDRAISNWYVTEAGVMEIVLQSSKWKRWTLSIFRIFRNRSYVPRTETNDLFQLLQKDATKSENESDNQES